MNNTSKIEHSFMIQFNYMQFKLQRTISYVLRGKNQITTCAKGLNLAWKV